MLAALRIHLAHGRPHIDALYDTRADAEAAFTSLVGGLTRDTVTVTVGKLESAVVVSQIVQIQVVDL